MPHRRPILTLLLTLLLHFAAGIQCANAQTYRQNVQRIMNALAADSLTKAERLIRETLLLAPGKESNAILYQYLGNIYQREGDTDKALSAYASGMELSPTPGLLLSRASLYLQADRMDQALADYNSVLELEEDNAEALFFRAYIYSRQRRNREARTDYQRLLELNPMHEDARLGLAILNGKDGRPAEAMEQLDALVLLYPTHARHYLARCSLYGERREYEKAMEDAVKAISLEPQNPECYLARASLYLLMKESRLARKDCRTAISLGASMEQVEPLLGDGKDAK